MIISFNEAAFSPGITSDYPHWQTNDIADVKKHG